MERYRAGYTTNYRVIYSTTNVVNNYKLVRLLRTCFVNTLPCMTEFHEAVVYAIMLVWKACTLV